MGNPYFESEEQALVWTSEDVAVPPSLATKLIAELQAVAFAAQGSKVGAGASAGDAARASGSAAVSAAQAALSCVSAVEAAESAEASALAIPPLLEGKADLVGGLIPASQLPSYVDDVLEFSSAAAFPVGGEPGKIYLDMLSGWIFRWGGTTYVRVNAGVVLGETSATAYRGDRGKMAYDHRAVTTNPHAVTKAQVGLGNAENTSDAEKPVSTAMQSALDKKIASSAASVTPSGGKIPVASEAGTLDAWISAASHAAPGVIAIASAAAVLEGIDQGSAVTPATLASTVEALASPLVKAALNSLGSAPIFALRAWANFNAIGTLVVNASGNISSITDRGVGDFEANLEVPLQDEFYGFTGTGKGYNTSTNTCVVIEEDYLVPRTAASIRFNARQINPANGGNTDLSSISIFFVR